MRRSARDTSQHSVFLQLRVVRVGCVSNCHGGTVVPKPMSRTAAILYAIGLPLALVALVFLPAGRIDWAPGWIFIAVLVAAFGVAALLLAA